MWGSRRPDAGARPRPQVEKGGACKTHCFFQRSKAQNTSLASTSLTNLEVLEWERQEKSA